MSSRAAPVGAHAAPRQLRRHLRRTAAEPLTRVRRAGYAVLAVQLGCICAWSAMLYHRYALSFDFAVYHQPWYLIAHGNLDPYSSVSKLPFWRNDAEFALWPLAALYWVWPHDVVLLWAQDAGVVAAEALAFGWLCDLAGRWCSGQQRRTGRDGALLAGTGLILLAANPWIWWAISFDYHEECLAIPFAVLLARDLARGRRRMWLWLVPILAAGAPAATYVVGVGLGGVLAGRRRARLNGALLAVAGIAYSGLIVALHADAGAPLTRHYGYLVAGAAGSQLTTGGLLKGLARHPLSVVRALWAKRVDVLANLAPAGLLGLGYLRLLPLMLVVLLANTLSSGARFAEPLFQTLPVYVLLPVGSVAVLAWLAARHRRTALVLAALLAVQAAGWAVVWGPRTPAQWLRVSAPAAATLAAVQARIPAAAEVIASQGVVGRFSGRADVHELAHTGSTPVTSGDVWFVITPTTGVELEPVAGALALIGKLAGPLHATLVAHGHGVWAFHWHPPPGLRTLRIPDGSGGLPAWAAPGAARAVLTGPVPGWHAASAGGPGYVADGLAWQEPVGPYQASVRLSASGPVNVEVWNDNGDVLLARRTLPGTSGVQTETMPVDAPVRYPSRSYSGWGPFRAEFVPPPAGQRLEIRVWAPRGTAVSVYQASLIRAP